MGKYGRIVNVPSPKKGEARKPVPLPTPGPMVAERSSLAKATAFLPKTTESKTVPLPPPNPMNLPIGGSPASKKFVPMARPARVAQRVVREQHRMRFGDYVPNNNTIWDAAFTGFWAGVLLRVDAESLSTETAAEITTQAQQFAVAVDQLIAPGTPNTAQWQFVGQLTQSLLAGKYATGLPASAYSGLAESVAKAYTSASAAFYNPGGGGGGSPPQIVIFRQGGVSSGNVYATAAEVASALNAANGALIVICDPSIEVCQIPNGVTWQCKLNTTITAPSDYMLALEILDGGLIKDPNLFQGIIVQADCVTEKAFDYTDWSAGPLFSMMYSVIQTGPNATVAPFQLPVSTQANGFNVQTYDSGFVNNGPAVPFFALAGSGGGEGSGANLLVYLHFNTYGSLPVTFLSGDSTTSLSFITDASYFPEPAWSLFTGSSYPTIVDNAVGIAYDDTLVSPRLYVSQLQAAIDSLKSGIGNGNLTTPGTVPAFPINTLVYQLDHSITGSDSPTSPGDPSIVGLFVNAGSWWYTLECGGIYGDISGAKTLYAPAVTYPYSAWNTQAMLIGGIVAENGPPLGSTTGDTLIGPSATNTYGLSTDTTGDGNAVTTATVLLQARVVSSSGATEAAGDWCRIKFDIDITTIGGSAINVISGAQTLTSYNETTSPSPGTMAGVTITASVNSGGQVTLTPVMSPGFDPSTVVDLAIYTKETYTT